MGTQLSNVNPFGSSLSTGKAAEASAGISDRFRLAYDIASVLMHASLLPDHFRFERKNVNGNWKVIEHTPEQVRANVIMVVNRALQWDVDAVALIGESFVVGGKLDFQGKVIIAVVNKLGGLRSNLSFSFEGEGDEREVIVSGELKNEPGNVRQSRVMFRKAVTRDKNGKINEQWTKDPDQKLAYSGAKKWARMHTPEVVLGLFSEDDQESSLPSEPRTFDAIPRIAEAVEAKADDVAKPKQPRIETFQRYMAEVKAATTHDELQGVIARIYAEPSSRLATSDAEEIRALGRTRWDEIKAAKSLIEQVADVDFTDQLAAAMTPAALRELRREVMAAEINEQTDAVLSEISDRLAVLEPA